MKPLVLDTNALLWLIEGTADLGLRSRDLAHSALSKDALLVSAFSFWEVGMLVVKGRLSLDWDPREWRDLVLSMGVQEVAVSGDVAVLSTALEGLPGDPADRIIVATTLILGATLLTADGGLLRWNGELARHDARL